MVEIKINIDAFTVLTKRVYVMQHLFQLAMGNRKRGEAIGADLYKGWTQMCLQIGRKPGKNGSFQHEMGVMQRMGIVEVSRKVDEGDARFPRNIYILSEQYFRILVNESRKAR